MKPAFKIMQELKIFGVCNALAVLGLVFGLASTAVATTFPAITTQPVLWLDAGAGVTPGGTFTWADQSAGGAGGHNATQDGADSQPTLQTNVINGLPVVRFDGNDDWLQIADHADLDIGHGVGKGFTAFAVYNSTGSSAQRHLFDKRGTTFDYGVFNVSNGSRWYVADPAHQNALLASPGPFSILSYDMDQSGVDGTSGTTNIWVDGVADNDNPQSYSGKVAQNDDPLFIGRHGAILSGYNLQGDLAELIIFNTTLSATDLNDTGYYLADKYGLTTEYAIPEPTSILLMLGGLVGMLLSRRRRHV